MTDDREENTSVGEHGRLRSSAAAVRHGGGFVVSGLIAFVVDAGSLWILTRWAKLDPFSARLIAIAIAMVVAWQAHRRLTFRVKVRSTLGEFVRFASVASTSAVVNYVVYAAILVARAEATPLTALVGATLVAMTVSYIGMRFGVFRKTP